MGQHHTVLTIGQSLQNGQYTIERELGQGRFSISYVALKSDGTRWVIKVLNPQLLLGLSDAERDRQETLFMQEAAKLSECSRTPHIAQVGRPFKADNLLCLPTEYLAGNSLAERAESKLLEETALGYIQQIGAALTVVHEQELVHRDIRPANIFLRIRESTVEAVLTNFELAVDCDTELSRTRKKELTDGFSPIELYSRGQPVGPYTDVYALAATLYELLTGVTPVSAEARKVKGRDLIPPKKENHNISGQTIRAIEAGMAILPGERPKSVKAWLAKLDLNTHQPKSSVQPSVNWTKWGTICVAITAAITLLGIIPGWIALRNNQTEQRELQQPELPPETE